MVLHGFPRRIVYDEDAGEALSSLLMEYGISRVLVVTDRVVGRLDKTRRVLESLRSAGFTVTVYDDVPEEPPFNVADRIAEAARGLDAQAIVAIGGGSVIDAAKAGYVRFLKPDTDLHDVAPFSPLGLESGRALLVAVPTTSGTGSDVTYAMVLTETSVEGERKKVALAHYDLVPFASILDPEYPAGAPRRLAVYTAMDALTHALETLGSTGATPISDALAYHAAELLFTELPRALSGDRDAWARVHAAASMAGMAFTNGGLGLAHAIGHPLGAALGTHHGATVGILLPSVIRLYYRVDTARSKYERLRRILEHIHGLPAGEDLSEHIENLYRDIGAPLRFRDLGVDREKYETAASTAAVEALHDPDIAYAPIVPGDEELKDLILRLY